jgi:exodeoxyribonuclease VII large subunit
MESREQVLSVTQLTREIREVLEGRIGSVWVEGEISNHRLQSSGHQYFTLKDSGSQVSCVMFRGAARAGLRLMDGAQVQVFGTISVYEPRGQYQLVVRQVQMKGQGSLQARFEALKRKLYEEGLFDEAHKKPVPKLPRVVALVTSPTGAAIQDMLNILTRRAPWLHVMVFPVRVQGLGVEKETIEALRILNQAERHGLPVPDTIVIGRGGGSIEDLWAYNEESLARAIYGSRIAVISAVGHEIDFTIADFVADLRAPTPSAAAELIAPEVTELRRFFDTTATRLQTRVEMILGHHEQVLDLTGKGPLQHEPERFLDRAEQGVDELESRLLSGLREQLRGLEDQLTWSHQVLTQHHPRLLIQEAIHRLQTQGSRLRQTLEHRLVRLADRLSARQDLLRHLIHHDRRWPCSEAGKGGTARRQTHHSPA